MKVSVSLTDRDLAYLDELSASGVFESRSAAIQGAIQVYRDRQYVDSYAAAWDEWDADKENVVWDRALVDGLA